MKQIVRIYICDREIELSQPFDMRMNYTNEDFNNPTIVKVGYSKTMVIPGTQINNQIFGEIWDLKRSQMYGGNGGVYFDPSKRASCEIYHNSEKIDYGYVKLDNIERKNGEISYKLTFYSGLGDFFYSMSYGDDGGELTLADLDYVDEGGNVLDLGFKINKEAVRDAWNGLRRKTDDKWAIVNFAAAYEGIPQELTSDAALINFNGNHSFSTTSTTKDGKTYSATDGYALASLKKPFNEWEMKDLRSYLQRPILSVKGLWRALQYRADKLGWKLELDHSFFNNGNPYYEKSWITLPMLSSLDDVGGDTYTSKVLPIIPTGSTVMELTNIVTEGNLYKVTDTEHKENYIPVNNGVIDFSQSPHGEVECTVFITLNAETNAEHLYLSAEKTDHYKVRYDGDYNYTEWDVTMPVGIGRVMVQLLAYDHNNNIIGGSPAYTFSNSTENRKIEPMESTDFQAPVSVIDGHFERGVFKSDGVSVFPIAITKIPKQESVRFAIKVTSDTTVGYENPQGYSEFTWGETHEGGWDEYVIIPVNEMDAKYKYRADSGSVNFYEYNTINSGTEITTKKLLQGLFSPLSYMISYTKLFGLSWIKDNSNKIIYVVNRNTFYNGEIEDISHYIDYSKPQTITPIVFNSKYYDMQFEVIESDFRTRYQNDYGMNYGRQRLNTGYNFDSSINNIYEGNQYKSTIMGLDRSIYYKSFKNGDYWYPSCLYDGLTYELVNENDEDETTEITANMEQYNSVPWNDKVGYDMYAKPSFQDMNRGRIDGSGVLLFFDGFKTTKMANGDGVTFWLTDDIDTMYKLNESHPCWLLTDSETDINGNTIALAYNELPSFSRYYTNDNIIIASWDFGEPMEIYADLQSNKDSTIYDQFWKALLADQFNINTKILDTYVQFDRNILVPDMLRKIYYFDKSYWILNKIIDYNITSYDTVKSQFIKIMDIRNYTQGQMEYPEEQPVIYNVVTSLKHATYNGPMTVGEYGSLQAQITIENGYRLYNALIMMDNQDITAEAFNSSTGVIRIPEVIGDISITVEAELIPEKIEYVINLSITNESVDFNGYVTIPYTANFTDVHTEGLPETISLPIYSEVQDDFDHSIHKSTESMITFIQRQTQWGGDIMVTAQYWNIGSTGRVIDTFLRINGNNIPVSSMVKTLIKETDSYAIYIQG